MDWNQITALPWFWEPFHSLAFTLVAVPLVPILLALLIGVAMFRRRVGGTYFAIITQAIAAILTILIIGQQGYTGGVNGITDLRTLDGWDIRSDNAKDILYFVNALAGIGGAMFTLQVGFMSPSFVGIVPSIEMVIFCVVGGRTSILGAVYGALMVNWARTTFFEGLPQLWLFAMGSLFILVVVAFPNGLAGLYRG
jgi:urea transport system permease protein